jgi:carbamoyl-phosphate synthase large subunit
MKVLVTAVGSPLGQSVAKALHISSLDIYLHLSDHSHLAAGFKLFSNSTNHVTPSVKSDEYHEFMVKLVLDNEINIIFPLLNIEFEYFDKHANTYENLGVKIVATESERRKIVEDKFASIEHLRKKGISTPFTIVLNSTQDIEIFESNSTYPAIIKPILGASSQGVFLVKNREQALAIFLTRESNYFVMQEFLSGDEYTVGVFRAQNSSFIETFCLKRELKFGLSYSGEVVDIKAIDTYAKSVIVALDLYNSNNVQLRIIDGVPFVFEINPRLSSTTSIRAHFGFNEPEMIIRDIVLKEELEQSKKTLGKFSRYWEEIYFE